MSKHYKIREDLLVSLYKRGKTFKVRALVNEFGNAEDILKMNECNKVMPGHIKNAIENLELNNLLCEKRGNDSYFVKVKDKSKKEEFLKEAANVEEKDELAPIGIYEAMRIRPISKRDSKLLVLEKSEDEDNNNWYIKSLLCALLLNKMIKSVNTQDGNFFNGGMCNENKIYNSFGSKTFFLMNINAINVYNYAVSNSPQSQVNKASLASKDGLSQRAITALCETLNECLNDSFISTIINMERCGLIDYSAIKIGVKSTTVEIKTDKGVTYKKKQIYDILTREQESLYVTGMDTVYMNYPKYKKNDYLIIKNRESKEFRKKMIQERVGYDDCFNALSITFTDNKEVRSFMSYYQQAEFDEAKYLEEFYTSMLSKVMARKSVDTLPEAEKELIKDICLSMLDPKSEDLFEKPAPKVVDMNVEKEVHIINVKQEII